MLRQPRIQASRASPAQKSRGLRVVLFQKLFQGYIFCFLGDSFGQCIFEQYARETNLKKKRSVSQSRIGIYIFLFTVIILFKFTEKEIVNIKSVCILSEQRSYVCITT